LTPAGSGETVDTYAHPETLVSTDWVADHASDPTVRVVEVDGDVHLHEAGHIDGAIVLDWHFELQDPVERDFVKRESFEALMSRKGIAETDTVVFYGDKSNCFATYCLWLFKLYGHEDVRIMDGGRVKWEQEGRPWSQKPSIHSPARYAAQDADLSIRAFRDEVFRHMEARRPLIDVRSWAEYWGELTHLPDYPHEGAHRGGHIPGSRSIPWAAAANTHDGTFKSPAELLSIYRDLDIDRRGHEVIAYCRSGERSSHTWYVLTYLLGYPRVKNYDGSWTEWGNLVAAPIEKSEPACDE